MESGTNNIARLHLLLCAAQPCLLGPLAGDRFRDPADRQEQRRQRAGAGTEQARLSLRADQPGRQYRPLPAAGARTPPDPPGAGGAAALPSPADHRHQGLADPSRPRPAARTGGAEPGGGDDQPDHPRRRAEAHSRTARGGALGATAGDPHAQRQRHPGGRALLADDPDGQRHGAGAPAPGGAGRRRAQRRVHAPAPAARSRPAVRGMAGGALPATRRACDEPGPPMPWRRGLRQPLRPPLSWPGTVRRPAGAAFRGGDEAPRAGPPRGLRAGLQPVRRAGGADGVVLAFSPRCSISYRAE